MIVRGDEVHVVDAHPIPGGKLIDTTGAGDLYAAGFLHGFTRGYDLELCGRLGALAAAEVISHLGARPEANLAELAAPLLPTELMAKGSSPGTGPATRSSTSRSPSSSRMLGGGRNDDLIFELIASALRLARDGASRGRPEGREHHAEGAAVRVPRVRAVPRRRARRRSSARPARCPDDPLYDQARRLAAALAERELDDHHRRRARDHDRGHRGRRRRRTRSA